ncbi:MAG: hydrogenase maturation protease [Saprospiraceae bacterium]|nr:hydrogenase maturation protease [Saprospiraceae bacterium]
MKQSILILGVGNILMGDEGFGVQAVNALEKLTLPDHVAVLDGGTGGFQLLGNMEGFDRVIMIDATLDENPPGTVRKIKPRFAADFPRSMSTHDIGLRDLVVSLQLLDKMPELDLIVVSIHSVQQQGVFLTPEAELAKTKVIDMILDMIGG